MIKSGLQTAQKQRFKQPNTAAVQKVQVEDIQICNDEVEDIQISNDCVEDIQISNDAVEDIQMNTTAINGYKFK